MAEPPETRREYLVVSAVDPETGGSTTVQISYNRLQAIARRSMGHAKEAAYIVPQILQRPTAIFEGLKRDQDEDQSGAGWRCYCGTPSHSYRANGVEAPPYPGQVYLVFVNDDHVAYNWRWEKADLYDSQLPIDYGLRFKTRRL